MKKICTYLGISIYEDYGQFHCSADPTMETPFLGQLYVWINEFINGKQLSGKTDKFIINNLNIITNN